MRGDSAQLVPLMEGFRATIIGLAMVGISAAWVWHLPLLLVLSLAIGGGETLETSLILFALRHGANLEIGRPRAGSVRGAGRGLVAVFPALPAGAPLHETRVAKSGNGRG